MKRFSLRVLFTAALAASILGQAACVVRTHPARSRRHVERHHHHHDNGKHKGWHKDHRKGKKHKKHDD